MTMSDPAAEGPILARGDGPALRACMSCRAVFDSSGFGERICKRCKGQSAWKSALPGGDGGSRRRSSARN